jgi:2-methylisocitrate lyase-like PEP mutase family enzyme
MEPNPSQDEQADALHGLHRGPGPLVLVNVWDAGSAVVVQRAGARVIATSSAGMAWSLGRADGERMPRDEFVAACTRICRVARVPVTVDIERGFGLSAEEVCSLVRDLIDLGVVGVNIEDGVSPDTEQLLPPTTLCERIAMLRTLADRTRVRLFINARTDAYLTPQGSSVNRFETALQRAQLYARFGADGIFVPGMDQLDDIKRFCGAIQLPLNVYAGYAGVPDIQALADAGVRRVSTGCGPLQSAFGLLGCVAEEAFTMGRYDTMTERMASAADLNALFTPPTQ